MVDNVCFDMIAELDLVGRCRIRDRRSRQNDRIIVARVVKEE